MVKLYPEGSAEARFKINGVRSVYIYCNKNGLYKVNITLPKPSHEYLT